LKIDRVNYTHTYQIGLSQWQKVGMEASIDDTEDPKECLAKLEQEAHNFHRQSNPQLYKNGNEALVGNFAENNGYSSIFPHKEPKVINRKYEEMEGIIKDCKTMEELSKWKDKCSKEDVLRNMYMDKMKELTEKMSNKLGENLTGGIKV